MADDPELDFEDRYSDVPVPTPDDEEAAKKKADLLKLATPQAPAGPKEELRALLTPVPAPTAPPPQIDLPPVRLGPEPVPSDIKLPAITINAPVRELPVQPRSGTAPPISGMKFTPEVEHAIDLAAKASGLPREAIAAIASIESGGKANSNIDKKTQYKGLFQIGNRGADSEWAKRGQGDIYNADDNALAMARLVQANRDSFMKHYGREPTPAEVYLMHQQGLGFFTRGAMTNIKGNPYPGMHGPQTHDSFLEGWTRELEKRMARAGGGGKPYVPNSELASFMNPEPTATQKPELSGGTPDTPAAAAQMAALMSGTPLEQIKGVTDKMTRAGIKGAISDQPGQVSGRVKGTPQKQMPEGVLPQEGSVTHTPPNALPVPGMPTVSQNDFLRSQITNPTVLSTAATFLNNQPPPPPGVMDMAKSVLAKAASETGTQSPTLAAINPAYGIGSGMYGNLLGQLKDYLGTTYDLPDITKPENWTSDTAHKLIQVGADALRGASRADQAFTKGAVQGVVSQAGNIPISLGQMALAAGYKMLGNSPTMMAGLQAGNTAHQQVEDFATGVAGAPTPEEQGDIFNAGKFAGQNIGFGPISTAINVGASYAMPSIMDYLVKNAPELPNLNPIGTAEATDLTNHKGQWDIKVLPDGKTIIAQTAAGPVTMDPRTANALGWLGIGTLGFMLTPGALKFAYENTPVGNGKYLNDLVVGQKRDISGLPGSELIRSNVFDYLKSQTLSTKSPLTDILERWANDPAAPANAKAVDHVIDTTHIYSSTGVRNLVTSAMVNGELRTPTLVFRTQGNMAALHDFAANLPEFREYMRLSMHHDELSYNNYLVQRAVAQGKSQHQIDQIQMRNPLSHQDIDGNPIDLNTVERDLRHLENNFPDVVTGHNMFTEQISEGQRFVSSGQHAPQNWQELTDHTQHAGSTPVFRSGRNMKDIWEEVRSGQDPLHVLERELDQALSHRMQNESHWTYIDSMPANTHFREVDRTFLKSRTVNKDAIFEIKRDGVTHTFVADPFVVGLMKLDPIGYTGVMDAPLRAFKSTFQAATTNVLAPFFAPTAAMRTFEQALVTAPAWSKRAGPIANMMEIPRALTGTQAAMWKPFVDATANWAKGVGLGNVVGDHRIDLVARILTAEAAKDFNRRFEVSGGTNASWLDADAVNQRRKYINASRGVSDDVGFQALLDVLHKASRPLGTMSGGYKNFFRKVADAPNMAWARKNQNTIDPTTGRKIGMSKLAAESRRLTGDPAEKGGGWYKDPAGNKKRMTYQSDSVASQTGIGIARKIGGAVDFMHGAIPWSGVLVRSPAATFTAMANHPLRSAAWLTATQMMPEALAYAYNRSLGPEYINHMMEGRSENMRNNYTYVGIPGRKPWEGIEIPQYQEGIPIRRGIVSLLDQMVGRSAFTPMEDFNDWWQSALKTMAEPPLPSPISAGLGLAGVTMPEGVFGGAFMAKNKGFKDLNKPDNVWERLMRATMPSIADFWSQYYQAYHAAPSVAAGMGAGAYAVGHRAIQRTALVRDVLGVKPAVTASTRLTEELYRRKESIDSIAQFYSKEDKNRGYANTKGASRGGMSKIGPHMEGLIEKTGDKTELPGLPQTEPTNPVFKLAMKAIEHEFIKDSPAKGGHGYKSMLSVYGTYSRFIDSMRNVNDGNPQVWLDRMNKNPKRVQHLKDNGIDPTNFRAVKDFYSNKRNLVAKEIYYYMRAGEQQIDKIPAIRQALGPDQHFTIDMADPYKPGLIPKDKQ